jgi:hypothetical protein
LLRAAGATQYMLASAMMETEMMDATTYADGDNKTGDSWNGGVCKQNWGMMRKCHPAWQSLTANDYASARPMNTNRSLDVTVYNECRAFYGTSWWAGQRNGSSGLANPNTPDIQRFKLAEDWTNTMVACHLTDDIRFWANVPAIILR